MRKEAKRLADADKIGSDISSSEDELLTGGQNYSPIADFKVEPLKSQDDEMSLSSLSSNEKIVETIDANGAYQYYGGYPTYGTDWRQAQYPYATHPAQQMYMSQYPMGQFPFHHQYQSFLPRTTPAAGKEDPHATTIAEVVEQIAQELKQILKKDFNKKMVENTAFKKFEAWWEEESTRKKQDTRLEKKEEPVQNDPPTKDNINFLLEANRDSFDGLGLGLRASLPKMPSFRRKKIPSPVQLDEDSRKASDNEEIVQNSDDDTSTSTSQPASRSLRRVRKASTSSSSSYVTSSSSSSDDDSSDSDSRHHVRPKVRNRRKSRSVTPEGRKTPMPSGNIDFSPLADMDLDDISRSPIDDGIEARCITPEPMQIQDDDTITTPIKNTDDKKEKEKESKKKSTLDKLLDGDSDLSDDEREYLERRRRNTEWMAQIEQERLEMELEAKKQELEELSRAERMNTEVKDDVVVKKDKDKKKKGAVTSTAKKQKEDVSKVADAKADVPQDDMDLESSAVAALALLAAHKDDITKTRRESFNGDQDQDKDKAHSRLSESSDVSSPRSQVAIEHSYCMLPTPPDKEKENQGQERDHFESDKEGLLHDHGGYLAPAPPITTKEDKSKDKKDKEKETKRAKAAKPRKSGKDRKFQELQNLFDQQSFFDRQPQTAPAPKPIKFTKRDIATEMTILYEFLTKGIDAEDIGYMKSSYEALLANDSMGYWLNDTHWVDHSATDLNALPSRKRKRDDWKVHATGCARTEGYYKIAPQEKAKYKYHHARSITTTSPGNFPVVKQQQGRQLNIHVYIDSLLTLLIFIIRIIT